MINNAAVSKLGLLAMAMLGLCELCQASETRILRFDKIIDGTGWELEAKDIAIRDGVIISVGTKLDQSINAAVIDFDGLTAMPGIIDAHTHITYGLPSTAKGDAWAELGQASKEQRYIASIRNAMLTLGTGVTTVRDLNADQNLDFELRDAIDSGEVIGPRIFASGPGIHPFNDPLPEGVEEASAAFLRVATEKRIEAGADWIKIFGTTGSASDLTSTAYYTAAAIAAATDVAKAAGKRITVHSYGPEAVDAAIDAGVTSLDHPVGISDEQIASMRDKGIIYVPTVDHNRYYAQHASEYGYTPIIQQNLYAFVQRNLMTVRSAHQAGVTIAMGSDAVMSGFGENTCELKAFLAAGMSNAEAIQSATINGAKLLGKEQELGRIGEGYFADIIGVRGDPTINIDAIISGVTVVIKEGVLVVDHRSDTGAINTPDCGTRY